MAEMIRLITEAGASPKVITAAVSCFEQMSGTSPGQVRDIARKYERERKAQQRKKAKRNKANAEANDAARALQNVRDIPASEASEPCNLLTPLSSNSEEKTSKKGRKKEGGDTRARGTRLSPDALLSDDNRQFALAQGARDPDTLWVEFRDYWIGVPGQRGTKLDWDATWRNRVRAVSTSRGNANGYRPQPANDLATALRDAREYAASGDPGWGDVPRDGRKSGH